MIKKSVEKDQTNGKKVDGAVCLCTERESSCLVFENNVLKVPPPRGFSSFSSSFSLIDLTDEVLRDPVRRENTDHHHETQPRGTEAEQMRARA